MKWRQFFDYKYPTARQIKERYEGRTVDLNAYSGLTHENVADAIVSHLRGHALAIPASYRFWDRTGTYRVGKIDIPLDTPERFNKFGPEVNINTTKMGVKAAREGNFLPIPAMREAARAMSIEQAYRGFGYWGVRTKRHTTIPFDVLPEGQKFFEIYGDKVRIRYQHGDVYVVLPSFEVPSASREERTYEMHLRPMPTGEEPNVAWTEMHGDCYCERGVFDEIRSKKKFNDEFLDLFKYKRGEQAFCRHKRAVYERAYAESKELGKKPVLVEMFPEATGIMEPWYALKNKTIVMDKNGRARRPLKTETRILLGRIIAYDPDKMFAWK